MKVSKMVFSICLNHSIMSKIFHLTSTLNVNIPSFVNKLHNLVKSNPIVMRVSKNKQVIPSSLESLEKRKQKILTLLEYLVISFGKKAKQNPQLI